jgi:hypothetical protein
LAQFSRVSSCFSVLSESEPAVVQTYPIAELKQKRDILLCVLENKQTMEEWQVASILQCRGKLQVDQWRSNTSQVNTDAIAPASCLR